MSNHLLLLLLLLFPLLRLVLHLVQLFFPLFRLSNLEVGTDVTELLAVRKWEVPEVQGGAGIIIGDKPYSIPTTDELRVQSYGCLREALIHKPYYISTKMDGTSMTVYNKNGDVGVCSRENNLKETIDNAYWKSLIFIKCITICFFFTFYHEIKNYSKEDVTNS